MNNTNKILLVRHGAFGDCLLITPFIRHLRSLDSSSEIHVFSFFDFFSHYQEVSRWIDARKISLRQIASQYSRIYIFSYEQAPNAHVLDSFEFSSQIQLKIDAPFVPEFSTDMETQLLRGLDLRAGKYLVFAPFAGPRSRDIEESKVTEILHEMLRAFQGHKIVIFHNRPSIFKGVVNITGKRSFPEIVTLMKNSAACLTVDTGFMHLAQACETPTILISGSTDAALRITRPELTQVVQAPIDCLGCYHRHVGTFGTGFTTCFRADWACNFAFSTQDCIEKLRIGIGHANFKAAKTLRRSLEHRRLFQQMEGYGDLTVANVQSYYLDMIERERKTLSSLRGMARRWASDALKRLKSSTRRLRRAKL